MVIGILCTWCAIVGGSWTIQDIVQPDGVSLEVGGMVFLEDDSLLVCTRRGEVWAIERPFDEDPVYTLYADGLQEPLGLLAHEDWVYVVQRGELSRMRDTDGDHRMDELETFCDDWEVSGNYHEYAFGPRIDKEGYFWVTLNKPFGDEPFGKAHWRGWAARISPDGSMQGACSGLRSPAGVETAPWGDVFYTDNQGEWCGASKLSHLEIGDFHGHPHGIGSSELDESLVKHPGTVPDGLLMPEVSMHIPHFKLPAVWFPYDRMGRSPSGLVWDTTSGAFGPFAGQAYVGDQYAPIVMRVDLEQVDGHWQGACYPFLTGFACGITRLTWAEQDGAPVLLVGMTDRGWPSLGSRSDGVQRVEYEAGPVFAVETMRVRSDGFRLQLTEPIDASTAVPEAFAMRSFTYRLHSPYGSPEVDEAQPAITDVIVGDGGLTVDLVVDGLREGYVHELEFPGVRAADGMPLSHDRACYTLIRMPKP